MSATLPLELEEIILSYLHDDPSALKACALTCHRFVHPAQAFIFQQVELYFTSIEAEQRELEHFKRLLESSPHISNLITELSIVLDSYFRVTTEIIPTLPVIAGLKSIDLTDRRKGFNWDYNYMTSATLRTTITQHHSLVNLRLSFIVDLSLSFLEGLPSLEGLFLESVTFGDDDRRSLLDGQWTGNSHPFNKSPRLKFLRLDFYAFNVFVWWITHPNCSFDISSLQGLSLSMEPNTTNWDDFTVDINANIHLLLQLCSKSLRVFCYDPGFRGLKGTLEPSGLINIKGLSNLHTLRIAIREPIKSDLFNSWVVEFFGQIKSCKLLSEVSIKVGFTIIKQPSSVAALLDTIAASTQPCALMTIFVYRDSSEHTFSEEWQDEWKEVLKVEVSTTVRMLWAQSSAGFLEDTAFAMGADDKFLIR